MVPAASAGKPPRAAPPTAWAELLTELASLRYQRRTWLPSDAAFHFAHELSATWKARANGEPNGDVAAALVKGDRHLARIALILSELERPGAGDTYDVSALERAAHWIEFTFDCWAATPASFVGALSYRDERLDRAVNALVEFLERRPERFASRREVTRAHVGKMRTKDEIDALLNRYEARYPGSITTATLPGGGIPRTLIRAPRRRRIAPAPTVSPNGDTVRGSGDPEPKKALESDSVPAGRVFQLGDTVLGDTVLGDTVSPPAPVARRIFFDTETGGLDPRRHRLTYACFEDEVLRHPRDRRRIQRWLRADAEFLAHNIGFDLSFLAINGYVLPPAERWRDTRLIANAAGEHRQSGLRALAQKAIKAGDLDPEALAPEEAIKAWLKDARRRAKKAGEPPPQIGDAPSELLEPYVRQDVALARYIYETYSERLDGQVEVLALEQAVMPALWAIQMRGVPVDVEAAERFRASAAHDTERALAEIERLAGFPVNPGSAKQKEAAFRARVVDLADVPRTPKTGQPQFTAEVLEGIDDDLARELLAYASHKKAWDYAKQMDAHVHGGRLYGSINQIGAEPGRMSSSTPNLKNIPASSDLRMRHAICAAPGNVLVGADLSNVELRIMAAHAPGGRLERALTEGIDLHTETANGLGIDRDTAKRINFSIPYGAGNSMVASILGSSYERGKKVRDGWFDLYPEIKRLKALLSRHIEQFGYFISLGGRRHYFDGPSHVALAHLIQGTGSEMLKESVVWLHERGVPMVLVVHDEIIAEVPEAEAERTGELLVEALTRPGARAEDPDVDLVAEAVAHQRWSEFKDPDFEP